MREPLALSTLPKADSTPPLSTKAAFYASIKSQRTKFGNDPFLMTKQT
jgi:hypothetical protein